MNRRVRRLFLLAAACFSGLAIGASSLALSTPQGTPPLLAQANDRRQGVDLTRLRETLQAQNWRAADVETRRLLQPWIHPNGDVFGDPLPTAIPPDVVQAIDRLWTEASGGRFGFTAQKRIWEQVRVQHPTDPNVASRTFGDRVGWTRPTPDRENGVAPDWLTEPELTDSLQAPVGHFPWAGISWERITALLTQQSCGSCMVDAMYLQGERFQRYLPVFFNGLSTPLEAPPCQRGL